MFHILKYLNHLLTNIQAVAGLLHGIYLIANDTIIRANHLLKPICNKENSTTPSNSISPMFKRQLPPLTNEMNSYIIKHTPNIPGQTNCYWNNYIDKITILLTVQGSKMIISSLQLNNTLYIKINNFKKLQIDYNKIKNQYRTFCFYQLLTVERLFRSNSNDKTPIYHNSNKLQQLRF